MKEQRNQVSSSISWCSSYTLLLVILVPLIFVSGFVLVVDPRISFWVSVGHTARNSPSSNDTERATRAGLVSEESKNHVDLNPRVVGSPQVEETFSELSSSYNLSSSPTHSKQVFEIVHPPVGKEQNEIVVSSINISFSNVNTTMNIRRNTKFGKLQARLASVRTTIRKAAINRTQIVDPDYVPQGPMYHNSRSFHRSYLEMEKQFKVFVYEEGEPPLFHNGPCKSIYSSEGNFINLLEVDRNFRTRDPDKAHVYFLPFSVTMMVHYVYVRNSHDITPIKKIVVDYVNVIASKYRYWNRSLGADHFMLACHDWGPGTSSYVPYMLENSIRALCNANTSEGFRPSKDVSFPEINLVSGDIKGWVGGPSPSRRPILAFFAGGMHGPIRPVLLEHWKNKDKDIQVYERLPRALNYHDIMRKTKFCICPSGYEVASPRIVEAIYAGCVPVLISDHYVPPFSDVLNWKSFSVEVPVSKIPELKNILMNISSRQYIRMQRRVLQVRRHFEVNSPPKRFDVFHMILHSVWLRRLNVYIYDLV